MSIRVFKENIPEFGPEYDERKMRLLADILRRAAITVEAGAIDLSSISLDGLTLTNVTITGGNFSGSISDLDSPLPVSEGGTGADNPTDAKTNLEITGGGTTPITGSGYVVHDAGNLFTRMLQGTVDEIEIDNANGVAGNSIFRLAPNLNFSAKNILGGFFDTPAMIGIPTAPTAAPGTSTAQIATTEFVANANKHYKPLACGDPLAPDFVFNDAGDVIMAQWWPT